MKTVFVSYSTMDKDVAAKVKATLEAHGIKVTIDSESMPAGGDIRAFIDKSIRETQVTLLIVSKNSLTSDWVALESVESFAAEKHREGKKFIACFIDDEFLRNEFLIEAVESIDEKIRELDSLIAKSRKRNIDPIHLQTSRTRKFELRNNLSKILNRLRESLTLDIREPEFDKNLQRIITEINKILDGSSLAETPSAQLPARSGAITSEFKVTLEFKARLVDALLECSCMATSASRNQIISQLPTEIGTSIPRHENTKADVFSIVTRVNDFENGLSSLLKVVKFFEGNSVGWNKLQHVVGNIG